MHLNVYTGTSNIPDKTPRIQDSSSVVLHRSFIVIRLSGATPSNTLHQPLNQSYLHVISTSSLFEWNILTHLSSRSAQKLSPFLPLSVDVYLTGMLFRCYMLTAAHNSYPLSCPSVSLLLHTPLSNPPFLLKGDPIVKSRLWDTCTRGGRGNPSMAEEGNAGNLSRGRSLAAAAAGQQRTTENSPSDLFPCLPVFRLPQTNAFHVVFVRFMIHIWISLMLLTFLLFCATIWWTFLPPPSFPLCLTWTTFGGLQISGAKTLALQMSHMSFYFCKCPTCGRHLFCLSPVRQKHSLSWSGLHSQGTLQRISH